MTPKERILAALLLEEPDRVPIFEIGISTIVLSKIMGKSQAMFSNSEIIKSLAKIGLDSYAIWLVNPHKIKKLNEKHIIDEFGRVLKTANISLTTHGGTFYVDGWLKNFECLEEFPKPDAYDPILIKQYREALRAAGEDIYVIPAIMGLLETTVESIGFRDFSINLYRNPVLVERVLDRIMEYDIELTKILCDEGAEAILYGDDSAYKTGPFIHPKLYEKYIYPRLKRIVHTCRNKGAIYIEHTDGDIHLLIPYLLKAGVQAIHSWEPTANMTLEYGKRNFGDKICIIGNIDIAYLLPFGSAEDVKKAVKNAINTAAPGGGYILSASNVITDEVKPENFLIQIRAGKKYGKYPLSCKIQNN